MAFSFQNGLKLKAIEGQSKTELNNCLQMFCVSIRQNDDSRF